MSRDDFDRAAKLSCSSLVGREVDITYFPKGIRGRPSSSKIHCRILGCFDHVFLVETLAGKKRKPGWKMEFCYMDFKYGNAWSEHGIIEAAIGKAA